MKGQILPKPVSYLSSMPGVVWPALPGPRGVMRLALLHQLTESQWWPAERLREKQLLQLNALVSHARTKSAYFKDLLAKFPQTLSEEDWLSLPILDRDTVQTEKERIRCVSFPDAHGKREKIFSSGSTGKPVAMEQTELNQLYWEAFTLRDHFWHRRDFSGKLASLRHFPAGMVNTRNGSHGPNWGSATAELLATGPVAMLNIDSSRNDQLQWLRRENPDYLLVHPTVLDELLHAIASLGETICPNLREVRTISESLPDGIRERCCEILGVHLTDIYSTREAGYIALQCPDHPHYHVQAENARVEILNDNNLPCLPGEVGRVVVTPLHNFAFPLLRYEIGDYAEMGEPCPCGRGLPVLNRIMGRRRNMLTLPDGRRLWPILNFRAFSHLLPLRQMRMTQRLLDSIDVEIVTPDRPNEQLVAKLTILIQENLGYPFNLSFHYPENIPRSAGGKYEDFISLV